MDEAGYTGTQIVIPDGSIPLWMTYMSDGSHDSVGQHACHGMTEWKGRSVN